MTDLVLLLSFAVSLAAIGGLAGRWRFAQTALRQLGDREPQIDGLRGLCATWVALHHLAYVGFWKIDVYPRELDSPIANSAGDLGVAMFFLICAYLFWGKLSRIGSAGWQGWVGFLDNRVRRIVPMYVVAMTASIALLGLLGRPLGAWLPLPVLWSQAASAYSFGFFPASDFNHSTGAKAALGVAWTLRYEWLFYASLPLLALVRAKRWWWVWLPSALLANQLFFHQGWWDFFVYGSVARELSRVASVQRFARSALGAVVSIALVLATAYFVRPEDIVTGWPALLVSVAFLLVVGGTDWFGVLTSRGARLIGAASYSVYLLNVVVEVPVVHLLPSTPARWTVPLQVLGTTAVVVLVVSISLMTYRWVERPFQRTRRPVTPGVAVSG